MALDKNSIGGGKAAKEAPKKAKKTVAENDAAMAQAALEADPNVEYGNQSGDIAFVGYLGNPADPDTVTDKNTGEKTQTHTIMGYRFKNVSDHDIQVPDIGTTDNFNKNNAMDYNEANLEKTRTVKPGEEFDVTPFENATLISRAEYDGRFTGGEDHVIATYSKPSTKTKSQGVQVASTDNVPRVSLRLSARGESIKARKCIALAVEKESADGEKTKASYEVKPEFAEKWAPLFKINTKPSIGRPSGSGRGGSKKAKMNNQAAMFRQLVEKKTKRAAAAAKKAPAAK